MYMYIHVVILIRCVMAVYNAPRFWNVLHGIPGYLIIYPITLRIVNHVIMPLTTDQETLREVIIYLDISGLITW